MRMLVNPQTQNTLLKVRATSAMKRLFSSPNLIEVTQLKDTLERAGIACFLRSEISSCLAPEIPMTESMPEVWVQDDHKLAEALPIKSDWQAPSKPVGSDWVGTAS